MLEFKMNSLKFIYAIVSFLLIMCLSSAISNPFDEVIKLLKFFYKIILIQNKLKETGIIKTSKTSILQNWNRWNMVGE